MKSNRRSSNRCTNALFAFPTSTWLTPTRAIWSLQVPFDPFTVAGLLYSTARGSRFRRTGRWGHPCNLRGDHQRDEGVLEVRTETCRDRWQLRGVLWVSELREGYVVLAVVLKCRDVFDQEWINLQKKMILAEYKRSTIACWTSIMRMTTCGSTMGSGVRRSWRCTRWVPSKGFG